MARRFKPVTRETASATPRVTALVIETGYRGAVIDRLLEQTADLVGATAACLVVRDPDRPGSGIVSGGFGIDDAWIGRSLEGLDEQPPALLDDAAWVSVPATGGGRGLLGIQPGPTSPADIETVAAQSDVIAA